jgi:hypothetical protein
MGRHDSVTTTGVDWATGPSWSVVRCACGREFRGVGVRAALEMLRARQHAARCAVYRLELGERREHERIVGRPRP